MKKLVIVFAVLVMLTGAAISVLKTMQMGPFASGGKETSETAPAPEPPRVVDMAPLLVPIIAGDTIATTIQIQIKLEAIGAANQDKITQLQPRLADAFLRDLYTFIPRMLRKSETLSVTILKERLQMVADRVTGPGVVANVLVQSVTDTAKAPSR